MTNTSKGNGVGRPAAGDNGVPTNEGTTPFAAAAHGATTSGGASPPSAPSSLAPSTHLAPVSMVAPGWTYGYQELQRQTADAHMSFQNAMAQAHIAFLQTAEQAMTSLASMAAGTQPLQARQLSYTPSHIPQALLAPALAPVAAPMAPPAVAPPAVAPLAVAPPAVAPPAPTALPVAPPPAAVPSAPAVSPTEAPAEAPAPAEAEQDVTALLLEVVADKTGYPAEMLSMDMALEGDLGIDSIKRVEILSAVRTRLPNLPEVDTKEMIKLATLGDVVAYMESSGGVTAAASEAPRPKAGSAATP